MENIRTELSLQLDEIRQALASDFSAIARLDIRENRIRWEQVSGNISDRLQHMMKKPGSGITGHVIRFGRPYILDANTPQLDQERQRYPIMLAEKLMCVMAIPISREERIAGVLILGHRQERFYTNDDVRKAVESAKSIASIVE